MRRPTSTTCSHGVHARREIGQVLRQEPDNLDGWRESLEIALAKCDDGEAGRWSSTGGRPRPRPKT
jgi:hypothetical protein